MDRCARWIYIRTRMRMIDGSFSALHYCQADLRVPQSLTGQSRHRPPYDSQLPVWVITLGFNLPWIPYLAWTRSFISAAATRHRLKRWLQHLGSTWSCSNFSSIASQHSHCCYICTEHSCHFTRHITIAPPPYTPPSRVTRAHSYRDDKARNTISALIPSSATPTRKLKG